jgi:hypothetical protein
MYSLWDSFFKLPIDSMPKTSDRIVPSLRAHFFDSQWYAQYDFIEFLVGFYKDRAFNSGDITKCCGLGK